VLLATLAERLMRLQLVALELQATSGTADGLFEEIALEALTRSKFVLAGQQSSRVAVQLCVTGVAKNSL